MRRLKKAIGGLRGRILLVILLVSSLTGIIVGSASYYIARSKIKDQVYTNLSNIARDIQGIISDVWVPTLERQMLIFAGVAEKLYAAYAGAEGIEAGIGEMEGRVPGVRRISVFLPGGYLLASSDPSYKPGVVSELGGVEPGKSLIIPFRLMGEPPVQERVMTVAAPIVVDGKVAAVLAGDITPEGIGGELGSLRVGSAGEVYLVNGDGQLVTLPPKAGEDAGLEILGEPLDTEGVRRVGEGGSGIAEYRNYAGEEVLGSYTWLADMGWGLMVEEDAELALSELDALRTSATLIVISMALVALLAAMLLSRRISGPLVALKAGAEKLGRGDFGYRVEVKGGEELESLAASFNRMAEAVQSSQEIIREDVRKRTRELQALNEMITSLGRTMSPARILRQALHLCMDFVGYESGWCYLAGGAGWKLLYHRCPAGQEARLPEEVTPGEGFLGGIVGDGKAVFWERAEEAETDELSACVTEGSFVALPLRSPSRMLGLICLASPELRPLSGETKATLAAMADEVGIALENALLYWELQEHVKELERANRELRSLDEMKSNFISAVTHELKQPLALIGGYASTIHDYYESLTYEEEMRCLRVILERTQFLTGLVDDLLDISMLEMGRIRLCCEELDLAALASKVVGEVGAGGEGQEIILEFPDRFPTVVADARRMEQVLSNLLANAVKFSHGMGEIRIRGTAGDDRLQVRVEDRGVGIDPSQLEKIFDRFYQVDASARRVYPGVGMGLFICRQLVEAHGGKIWAESRVGGGSAFVFELPLDPKQRK